MTGLQRAQPDVLGSRSPVYALFDLAARAATRGSSTYDLAAGSRFLDASGRVAAGVLAMLADACVGNAALTVLGPGQASNTSQLRLDFVGPPTAAGTLVGHGRVVGSDGVTVLAAAELFGPDGTAIAIASARCFVVPTAYTALGDPLPADAARIAIDPARPPIESTLGLSVHDAPAGGAELTFVPAPAHSNIFGATHGGSVTAVLEYAGARAAAHGSAADDIAVTALDVQTRYIRPVLVTGNGYEVRATTLHRTRRQAVVAVEVHGGGKMLATAQSTYLIGKAGT